MTNQHLMGHVQNLRDVKHLGRMLCRARERQGRSLAECAGLLSLKNQDLLHIENGNVFAFQRDLARMRTITDHYAQLLQVELVKPMALNASRAQTPAANNSVQDVPVFLLRA